MERLYDTRKLTGIIGQLEEGANGTRHFQFYCESKNRLRLNQWRQLLGPRVHIEQRRGTAKQAIAYCTKPDSYIGQRNGLGDFTESFAGERSDLATIQKDIEEGANIRDIAEKHFGAFIRYGRGIERYYTLTAKPRQHEMDVRIYWGRTGAGKTRAVYDYAKDTGKEVYVVGEASSGIPWFDGYFGQEITLIDDFYGWIKMSYMLKLLDRYPMNVQTKGGWVPFTSTHIFITSNTEPVCWYKFDNTEVKMAFFRRISDIKRFT